MSERKFSWAFEQEKREFLKNTAVDLITPVKGLVRSPKLLSIGDITETLKEENQGPVGSCAGHSLSTCVEVCYLLAGGDPKQFSRAYGYYAAQREDGLLGRDSGSTIAGGVTVAKKHGVPLEAVWPYTGRYDPHPPISWEHVYTQAEPYKIRSHTVIRNYDDAYDFLAAGVGAIHLGILWTSHCEPGRSGLISKYAASGRSGHAVSVPFLSTRMDLQSRPWLWLANSWGADWGNGGYAEIAPVAFDQMLQAGYTVAIGVSDLSDTAIEPRVFSFADYWQKRYGIKDAA